MSSLCTSQENGIAPHQIIECDEFSKPQTDMLVGIVTGKARLSPTRRGPAVMIFNLLGAADSLASFTHDRAIRESALRNLNRFFDVVGFDEFVSTERVAVTGRW